MFAYLFKPFTVAVSVGIQYPVLSQEVQVIITIFLQEVLLLQNTMLQIVWKLVGVNLIARDTDNASR